MIDGGCPIHQHTRNDCDYCLSIQQLHNGNPPRTKHVPEPKIASLANIAGVLFFYTRKEAADFAVSIGWPKKSARCLTLPYGRQRWVVSDDHLNVVMRSRGGTREQAAEGK